MEIRFDKLPAVLEWKYGPVADCELRDNAWRIVRWRHVSIPEPTEDQLVIDVREYKKFLDDSAYQRLRSKEYPSVEDQLDALWKGGPEAEAMRERIEAIKEKYPKPEGK